MIMKNGFLRTPMRVLTVVLMLFVVIPSSAFQLDDRTTVVYYWKVKSGKKALARKVISKQKWQCSDKVLTPYKYDAKYGGKEAFKYSPYTNKYKKKNRKYFFDHYSIVSKGIGFLDYTPLNLYVFFAVKTDDGYGFLDDTGNEVVPCNYAEWSFLTPDYIYKKNSDVSIFPPTLYRSEVYDEDTKYYSTYWNYRLSIVYTYIQMRSKEGKWQSFYFSSTGKVKKSAQYDYDEVVPFAGYWDSYKSIKWRTKYSDISNDEFINNYMATRKGNSWGIYSLDATREYVPCKFDKSSFICDNSGKLVIVTVAHNFFMKKGDMHCIVNEKGETVFSEKCTGVFPKYIKRGTWSHYYITNNNREFDLTNECYKAPSPYSWSWLGWNFKGCQKIEQNNLCGLYNGKTDSILLPCQYQKIGFDKDNTGFLKLTTAEGKVLTACLTADANRVIFVDNKADIVKQSTIVSNKDGYTTYRIGSGYGFMCNATGVCTAPIFTPDTVKVSNPKNIPLCQFYRGVGHGSEEHGAFAGNHFFCPKYSRIYEYKGDTLCIKASTPYIANLKNGKFGYWVETIYTENGEVKVGNNMNQWLALLKNKNYSAESIYKPIAKLLLELNYVEHGYVWDSNYAIELWRRGDYENAEYQLRLVTRWYKRSFPDKATMQQFYDDWTAYTVSVKNYSSALLACSQAKKGEYKVDSAQVKQILHDGPLYYALNGNLEKAKSLCQDGKQNFGIDQGDTFLNLVQSNYNLYLAREEARKREQEAKRQEEERQRQLELQRQREEAERQRLQRQQAWNNLANALGNLSQSLSNLSNKKKDTSYSRTTPSYNTTSSARSSSRTSSTSANSRNQKKVLSSMSTLSSTYRSYQSMLIKMNTYYEKQYNDSDRRKYQQAMREIRLKAEQYSNCSVFKSEWEDWDGRKR